MPAGTQKSRMQQRRGTTEQWSSLNPILKAGEIGYNTTDGSIKIGDGIKPWTALPTFKPDDGSQGFTGVPEAPMDGKDYLRSSGGWKSVSEIHIPTYNPVMPPSITEVNANGELSLRFELPFKYALKTTPNALEEVVKRTFRFPFAEGRIKRVSTKARMPAYGKYNVSVSGQGLFNEAQTVTDTWVHTNFNTLIKKDQYIEIELTGTVDALDLSVEVLIQVGNAAIEFIGTPDLVPNLYCWGRDQSLINYLSTVTPSSNPTLYNQYYTPRMVTCPSVTSIHSNPQSYHTPHYIFAKGENSTWYGFGDIMSLEAQPQVFEYAAASSTSFTPILSGSNIKTVNLIAWSITGSTRWAGMPLIQYNNGGVFLQFRSKHTGLASHELAALQNHEYLATGYIDHSSSRIESATIMLRTDRKRYKILYIDGYYYASQYDPARFKEFFKVGNEYAVPNGDTIKEALVYNKNNIIILTDNGTVYIAKYLDNGSAGPRLEEFNVITHIKPIKHIWYVLDRLLVYSDTDDVLWIKCKYNTSALKCIDWTTRNDLNPNIEEAFWYTWAPYKIGEFKVKRFMVDSSYRTFMLTETGELYGCGDLGYFNMKNVSQNVSSFTRICENFVFGDVMLLSYKGVLITIARKLGDMP